MRDRRQTISVLLSGVRAELEQRLLPAGVIAGTGISVARAGVTVTISSTGGGGGSSTFVDLTDTPAAITASRSACRGTPGATALVFGACGTGGGGGGPRLHLLA